MLTAQVIASDRLRSPTYRNGKSPTTLSDTYYGALAEMAEKLRRTIIALADVERFPHVQERVAKSVIVFGVWTDPAETSGFGFHLIRGRGHLAALSGELPDEMTTTAVPCVGLEQAIAAERLWSDVCPTSSAPDISAPGKRKKAKASPKKKRTSKGSLARAKNASRPKH